MFSKVKVGKETKSNHGLTTTSHICWSQLGFLCQNPTIYFNTSPGPFHSFVQLYLLPVQNVVGAKLSWHQHQRTCVYFRAAAGIDCCDFCCLQKWGKKIYIYINNDKKNLLLFYWWEASSKIWIASCLKPQNNSDLFYEINESVTLNAKKYIFYYKGSVQL